MFANTANLFMDSAKAKPQGRARVFGIGQSQSVVDSSHPQAHSCAPFTHEVIFISSPFILKEVFHPLVFRLQAIQSHLFTSGPVGHSASLPLSASLLYMLPAYCHLQVSIYTLPGKRKRKLLLLFQVSTVLLFCLVDSGEEERHQLFF